MIKIQFYKYSELLQRNHIVHHKRKQSKFIVALQKPDPEVKRIKILHRRLKHPAKRKMEMTTE